MYSVLENKPDRSICVCVDFRKLNEITGSEAYVFIVPRIRDILLKIGNAKFLSHIDPQKYIDTYHCQKKKRKPAHVTPYGLYEFFIMPFGMKTSPVTLTSIRLIWIRYYVM